MLLLIVFGFIAGAATALSPCVLPVLPVALSAGATGGRRRPLGVVTGLVLSFTFATVALVYLIAALGLPDDLLRNLAIAVLAGFGVALLLPRLAARLEATLSRLTSRAPRPRTNQEGFASGLLLGGSLGLLYAPCAGPILAGVITVSASQDFTTGRLAVAFAYALGSATVLYALMIGGRRLTSRLAPRAARLQMAMGALMLTVAVAMAAELDIRFQTTIADDLPAFLVNPSGALEESASAQDRLAGLRGEPPARTPDPRAAAGGLPVYGPAPEIRGTQRWFNTDGGRALTLQELRGRVVLIDFWTYSCINCIRTLPHLKAWDARYRTAGLTILGLHAPEFPFERDAGNVAGAIEENGIRYPVAQDNDFATWGAYENRYWPAKYLIDASGHLRYAHFGEGDYEETEEAIRELLAEAGRTRLGARTRARSEAARRAATPESYLGAERADRFANGPLEPGLRTYEAPEDELLPHHLALDGRWRIRGDRAVAAGGSSLQLRFRARKVFLVLGSPDRPRTVKVAVDGRPRPDIRVDEHDLYTVVELARSGQHLLTLEPEKGVEAYAFTFG